MASKLRKRYLVTEGDLFQLFAEIEQVRNDEKREAFMQRFKTLLREKNEVALTVKPKA